MGVRSRTRRARGGVMATFNTAVPTLEQHVENLDYMAEETEANIEEAYDAGELTDEEAAALLEDLDDDIEDRLDDLEDAYEAGEIDSEADDEYDDEEDDYDDDDEEELYSYGTPLATFATAAPPVGQAILAMMEDAGYDSVEDGIEDLWGYLEDATGMEFDEEEIVGLITGESLPDAELAEVIAVGFDPDEETFELFADAVDSSLSALDGEDGGYEGDDLEEDVDAVYSRVNDLETQIAEFQTSSVINEELLDLEREARFGMEEGWLPPAAKEIILGDFELDQDRVAAFSQLCVSNQVDPATELYATRKTLEAFKAIGPVWAQFGAMVEEPLTDAEIEEAEALQAQAQRNHALRKNRGRKPGNNGTGA